MKIEQAIQEILADATDPDAVALSQLLPTARIVTGNAQSDLALPFATLNLQSNNTEHRSNTASYRQPSIRIQVWHDDHAAGVAIREAIITLFENKSFTLSAGTLLLTRHENDFAVQEPDGTWQFVIDIETKTEE